jgi:hypothetical protein
MDENQVGVKAVCNVRCVEDQSNTQISVHPANAHLNSFHHPFVTHYSSESHLGRSERAREKSSLCKTNRFCFSQSNANFR